MGEWTILLTEMAQPQLELVIFSSTDKSVTIIFNPEPIFKNSLRLPQNQGPPQINENKRFMLEINWKSKNFWVWLDPTLPCKKHMMVSQSFMRLLSVELLRRWGEWIESFWRTKRHFLYGHWQMITDAMSDLVRTNSNSAGTDTSCIVLLLTHALGILPAQLYSIKSSSRIST